MAKRLNPVDDEEIVDTPETEETIDPTEEKPEAVVTAPRSKGVRIRTVETIDCFVAQVHYAYAKGKDVIVPSDVAAILTNSQKAFRL